MPCSAEEGKPYQDWILRLCPKCRQNSIRGHGRRSKQAHDERHTWIPIRRGICRPCHLTFTFLPCWSLPYTHYSLWCRQRARQSYRNEHRISRCAPPVLSPDRTPDESTLSRWLKGLRAKPLAWLSRYRAAWERLPTILAWDASRFWRNLGPVESHSHGPPDVG